MGFEHRPVMVREVIDYLGCKPGGVYVDGTVGGGGHGSEILKSSSPDGILVGIDRDEDALGYADKFLKPFGKRVLLVRENFKNVREVLKRLGIKAPDGILLDLGVSSYQLETPERGFGFKTDSRLDMRMDRDQRLSAFDLVNGLEAEDLARLFRLYGEERFSKRIAKAIVEARGEKPVETTGELAEIAAKAIPGKFRPRKIHPATRVFQALRIAVNDELENLQTGLIEGLKALAGGGRLVVISYHSLEDRIVKSAFRESSTGCVCPREIPRCVCGQKPSAILLTRKAVAPRPEEVSSNPRARSAKLRAVEKL
ncbi:MAG TPA: 16S rRNA (cytosine(1402)-N(4))-methyltransferase RsmH [Thermodesulfobacteriota bacterium]|nr:16S rRNA (cytosine(1402)-N(4))-methyltransferase RsmH [Thermodesulfobacteriota bacterium]